MWEDILICQINLETREPTALQCPWEGLGLHVLWMSTWRAAVDYKWQLGGVE